MKNKQTLIEVKNLNKIFKQKFSSNDLVLFDELNLDIYKNETLTIIGPNGAGKSTLIDMILKLTPITEGEINYPSTRDFKSFINQTGVQFQEATFPKGYTLDQIVNMIFEFNNVKPEKLSYKEWISTHRDKEKEELYNLLNLENKINRKVKKLSGGEKQRLNVMLALLNKPRLLILDEITTGLDLSAQNKILNYISKYAKRKDTTVILISHNLNEIETLSDRLIVLDDKKIVMDLTKKEVIKKYGTISKFTLGYFKNKEKK